MTPRNPDASTEETVQEELLQAVHEALTDEASLHAAQAEQDASVPSVTKTEPDTRVELDRVETYLKGPTVFSA
ncbi:hypothetical protein [Microvirga solisilvae]|uniref:hypothetical protein n=1 Tax=Microvirga solisilvae TaxID=2919498 RepID=UPI001FAFF1B8|nr:hypothetical protein [Microvirga solisilvae]